MAKIYKKIISNKKNCGQQKNVTNKKIYKKNVCDEKFSVNISVP